MMDTKLVVQLLMYCAAFFSFIILWRRDIRAFEKMHREKCDPWLFFAKMWRIRPIDKTDKYQVAALNYLWGVIMISFLAGLASVLIEYLLGWA